MANGDKTFHDDNPANLEILAATWEVIPRIECFGFWQRRRSRRLGWRTFVERKARIPLTEWPRRHRMNSVVPAAVLSGISPGNVWFLCRFGTLGTLRSLFRS
jgi:hypothetical protein